MNLRDNIKILKPSRLIPGINDNCSENILGSWGGNGFFYKYGNVDIYIFIQKL